MSLRRIESLTLAALLMAVPLASAWGKNHKAQVHPPADSIEVAGHIPLTGGPVTDFVWTQHYSSDYLYAEHAQGKNITLIDVTQAAHPTVLAELPNASEGNGQSLLLVTGTAALVSSDQNAARPAATPRTLKVMNYSDPQHPKVAREFTGVTAMGQDNQRGLVFVANGEGIWILQQHFALDPQVEEAYAREVMYNR